MSGVTILLNDSRGVFIPQNFVEVYNPTHWGFAEDDEDIATLRKGPEDEWYWDAWNNVLARAEQTDGAGNVWRLSQDGDLFAYCEALMDGLEYVNFFGYERDEDDGQPTEADEWFSYDEGC
jgi:hypothetical protein